MHIQGINMGLGLKFGFAEVCIASNCLFSVILVMFSHATCRFKFWYGFLLGEKVGKLSILRMVIPSLAVFIRFNAFLEMMNLLSFFAIPSFVNFISFITMRRKMCLF